MAGKHRRKQFLLIFMCMSTIQKLLFLYAADSMLIFMNAAADESSGKLL